MNQMLSIEDAKTIAASLLEPEKHDVDRSKIIIDDYTIERENCFVFFYDSKEFLKTGRFEDRLAGNAPILIDRRTGECFPTGTAYPVEHYIELFESKT